MYSPYCVCTLLSPLPTGCSTSSPTSFSPLPDCRYTQTAHLPTTTLIIPHLLSLHTVSIFCLLIITTFVSASRLPAPLPCLPHDTRSPASIASFSSTRKLAHTRTLTNPHSSLFHDTAALTEHLIYSRTPNLSLWAFTRNKRAASKTLTERASRSNTGARHNHHSTPPGDEPPP